MTPLEKSLRLLLDNLNPSQKEEFKANGYFHVEAEGEKYKLLPDITIRQSDGHKLCAVVNGLPAFDQMLARKLVLENDPKKFLDIANDLSRHNYRWNTLVNYESIAVDRDALLNERTSRVLSWGLLSHIVERYVNEYCAIYGLNTNNIRVRFEASIHGYQNIVFTLEYNDTENNITHYNSVHVYADHLRYDNYNEILRLTAERLVAEMNNYITSQTHHLERPSYPSYEYQR